jgi:serine/threonine protein kinase
MMFPEECLLLFSMIRDRMNIPDEWQGFAVFGIFRQFDQGTLRVLISTYQIIDSVTWNLTLALPPPFSTLLQLFSLLSFDFLQSRCLQLDTTVYSDVYFYALVPILFAGASLAVFFGKCFFAGRIPRRSEESAYSFAILVMTYLVLPPVSRVLLQALDCERLPGSGARVLRVDTNVDCDSATYKSFILVDALLIVVYMSVPLAWSVILCRNRARLNPKTTEIEVAQRLRDEDLELRPLSFLFDIYYPRFYFFEAIEMYRRVLFVGLLPLITTETDRRAALGLILALCSAILFRETEPYTLWTTNVIANVAQYTIFLTYGVALVINTDLRKGLSNDELGLFLFCVNLFVLSIAIGFGVERHLREDRLRHQGRRILTSQEFKIVDNVMKDEDGEPGDGDESDYEAGPDRYNSASRNSEFGGRPSTLMHRSANALSQHLLNPKDVKIIKRIGSGAFGEVFRGECLGQQIAVKTMHKVTDENVRFFRAEILLTATLRHPNIVNFVGACWGKELICLVLEWVPKGSLGDMLTDMAVDLRWDEPLLRLATDIARGMQYLHGREYYDERERTLKRCILHRDLKPQNALVTEFSGAKLADFGSSRAKSNRGVTMTAVGTPLYAAPELMRHESYDETIDVYSFGLMLLDMAVHGGLLDLVRGRWFVCHNADDGRCSSASEIERACKDHVDIRRVLRSMWDKQWRPVSDEWGIPAAPLSVVELIVACCAHDPAQRPSFSDIFHQLAGRFAAEIEAGAFRRWRIDEEKAALLERHLKLSTSSTTRTSHREPTLSVIVEGTSPVDSFEKSLALGSDLAVGKLGFGSSLRAPTNGGGSGAVGFGAVGFGGSQPNQRVSWSPMVGVRSSVTRSSRTVGLEERLLDSEEYLTPAVDAEAGWSSSSSAAVAAGSVTSTAGDSAASMAACSVASTASASPHDAQLFFQGVDTTNASTTTQKHTGFPSDV